VQAVLPLAEADGIVQAIHFSSDGNRLVVGAATNFVIFKTKDWSVEARFPYEVDTSLDVMDSVQDFAIRPDGQVLAIATRYQVHLVSLPTGQLLASPVKKFDEEIMALAFSPDGKLLASGGADKTVTLWDASSLKMISQLGSYEFPVWSLAFSPDGKYLANLGDVNKIHLWQVQLGAWQQTACELVNRDLTQTEWDYYLPGLPFQKTCTR
jgi:WD40 repeat protein